MTQNQENQIQPSKFVNHKQESEVCQIKSAGCITKYGMYLSEPWKYLGTHTLLHFGMALHYFATFSNLEIGLKILSILLHLMCTVALLILAFKDPGIIPKILPTYQKFSYRKIPTNYYLFPTNMLKIFHKNFKIVVKSHNLQLKFCSSCFIYRPPRAVHCQDCGVCIQKFDHHCPWIGTCVAKKNYKYFLLFLFILSILTTKIFIESIVIAVKTTNWYDALMISKSVINIFLCLYVFLAMGFAIFMFCLHLKFTASNVTTNEFCKETWENLEGNPFKKQIICLIRRRSWIKNFLKILSLRYQGQVNISGQVYDRNGLIMQQYQNFNNTCEIFNISNSTKQNNADSLKIDFLNQDKNIAVSKAVQTEPMETYEIHLKFLKKPKLQEALSQPAKADTNQCLSQCKIDEVQKESGHQKKDSGQKQNKQSNNIDKKLSFNSAPEIKQNFQTIKIDEVILDLDAQNTNQTKDQQENESKQLTNHH